MRDPQLSTPAAGGSGSADTKSRLLDAAERLFAERGFDGTSMRAVTQLAGAAVSAANYHFGSKQELLHATLRRHIEPINRLRLERLEALETRGRRPTLEEVLDAFLRPPLDQQAEARRSRAGGSRVRQLAVRLFADAPEQVAPLRAELFGEVNRRFGAALGRALPGASPEALSLILQLAVGLLMHTASGHVDPELARAAMAPDSAGSDLPRTLVCFTAAGARALASGADG